MCRHLPVAGIIFQQDAHKVSVFSMYFYLGARSMGNGKRQPDPLPLLKPSRAERIEAMDAEVLDVGGAAKVLGVSTRTIYKLARKGGIPALRIGREWRFARK